MKQRIEFVWDKMLMRLEICMHKQRIEEKFEVSNLRGIIALQGWYGILGGGKKCKRNK